MRRRAAGACKVLPLAAPAAAGRAPLRLGSLPVLAAALLPPRCRLLSRISVAAAVPPQDWKDKQAAAKGSQAQAATA